MSVLITKDIDLDEYIGLVKQFNLSSCCIKFTDSDKSRYSIWTDIRVEDTHIDIRTSSPICPAINLHTYKEFVYNKEEGKYE